MKKRLLMVLCAGVLAVSCLCSCGSTQSAGEAGGSGNANGGSVAEGQSGDNASVADSTESGAVAEEESGSSVTESSVEVVIPEYETDKVEEDAVFGTEEEAYELVLETDTFTEEMCAYISDREREGDWMRLSRGDIWFEIVYRSKENADEFLKSVIEYQVVQYYLQQTEKEPLDEYTALIHEMTKPVETDKYRIPSVMVDGQECKVTCYEYPIRYSVLGMDESHDVMDLVVIYRVDMPNGDALFFRGMRDHKTTLEFFTTQALDVWAIDMGAGETLHDVTEARFKEYAGQYIASAEENMVNEDLVNEFGAFVPHFSRLEEGLCELMETMVITVD